MVGLWCRLQQGYQQRGLPDVRKMAQGAHDLEGGAAVQPCTDLIQEHCLGWTHQQLTCAVQHTSFAACCAYVNVMLRLICRHGCENVIKEMLLQVNDAAKVKLSGSQ